jgi:hypothetical protein
MGRVADGGVGDAWEVIGMRKRRSAWVNSA